MCLQVAHAAEHEVAFGLELDRVWGGMCIDASHSQFGSCQEGITAPVFLGLQLGHDVHLPRGFSWRTTLGWQFGLPTTDDLERVWPYDFDDRVLGDPLVVAGGSRDRIRSHSFEAQDRRGRLTGQATEEDAGLGRMEKNYGYDSRRRTLVPERHILLEVGPLWRTSGRAGLELGAGTGISSLVERQTRRLQVVLDENDLPDLPYRTTGPLLWTSVGVSTFVSERTGFRLSAVWRSQRATWIRTSGDYDAHGLNPGWLSALGARIDVLIR